MPSSVEDLLSAERLAVQDSVVWSTKITSAEPGVYLVSLMRDPRARNSTAKPAPLDLAAVRAWLTRSQTFCIDGIPCLDTQPILERLARYWLPDENIVYIGKAASLRSRVHAYYNTPLGNRGPHAGGHWVKTLSVLERCYVHYALTHTSEAAHEAEKRLLRLFGERVSESSRRAITLCKPRISRGSP